MKYHSDTEPSCAGSEHSWVSPWECDEANLDMNSVAVCEHCASARIHRPDGIEYIPGDARHPLVIQARRRLEVEGRVTASIGGDPDELGAIGRAAYEQRRRELGFGQ
jgi:hypothetical protein